MTDSVFDRDRKIRSSDLTMSQIFYLVTLNQFIGSNDHAWPAQRTIAEAMNAGVSSVKKWQKEMQDRGIITVDSGVGCSSQNHYRLNFENLKQRPKKTRIPKDSNSLPCRPFDSEQSTSETINGLRGRPGMVYDVATKEHKKDQLKDHSAQPQLFEDERDSKQKTDTVNIDEVVQLWNELFESSCRATPSRSATLKTRSKDDFFVEHWRAAIQRARDSEFCCGHGAKGWLADLDWFLKPDSVTRLMEGKYDGKCTTTNTPAETREQSNAAAIAAALGGMVSRPGDYLVDADEKDPVAYLK